MDSGKLSTFVAEKNIILSQNELIEAKNEENDIGNNLLSSSSMAKLIFDILLQFVIELPTKG